MVRGYKTIRREPRVLLVRKLVFPELRLGPGDLVIGLGVDLEGGVHPTHSEPLIKQV